MKTTRFIVFSLLMSLALGVNARTFYKDDVIRVNTDQTATHDPADPNEAEHRFKWDESYAILWLYLYGQSGNEWVQLTYLEPNVFTATLPEGKNYDHLILVRKDPAHPEANFNDGEVWNRTCNLVIPDYAGCNVLYKFWKGGSSCDGEAEWHIYTPSINDIKSTISSVTQEEMEVCPSAAGTAFSLHPKIRTDRTNYEYENVYRHTWLFSSNKTNWTSLDDYTDNTDKTIGKERVEEFDKDFLTTLPVTIPSGGVYYYLYSIDPGGRRLIHVKTNPKGCELDCDITAFETANSAVNADNNTFTLDGMVAFGEANGKKLIIECQGQSLTINSPKSPQSFSLSNVPAATTNGQKTTATAHFEGGSEACSYEIEIDVPNATIAADTTTLDSLIGVQYVLIPADTIAANKFVWLKKNELTGDVDTIPSASKKLVIDAIGHDSTVTYIYKEYNPAPGSMENLMTNGSYEDTWDYTAKKVSEYDYWGTFPTTASAQLDFYNNTSVNPGLTYRDNGFAIIRNAGNFAPSFAQVKARDGVNFALFDAKSGSEGANMKAWCATTAQHPKLKLKKGTTYVLSFWAANINNYGEMDNAAEFEFRIETKAGALIAKSRKLLKLSDAAYRNNIWHQLSETFTAKQDYDDIVISVVNMNTKELKVGNDFALDDIQFHPISSVSQNVKSQQVFVVKAHEPQVDAFTATTVNMNCNDSKFTVNMNVTYRNAQGKLCIRDIDRDTIYKYSDVVAKPIDVQGTYTKSIVLSDELATVRNWEAYFEAAPANKKTAQSAAPQRQNCEKLDTTICEGQTLTWKGTVYPQTPYIGTDSFKNGFDSLILTINAVPRITVGTVVMTCDSANEVRIPFTVANGNPDIFDIAVNGSHYAGSMDGTDIVFSLTSMEAGDYSAVITSGETGVDCESTAPVSFTIALSGHVYSKWTDVLFISNKEGRFNGYQWFADGAEMAGETMQRLYDPKGLSGTTIQYHCRLTTTDGKTLYTCPQTFDEVTPSRTINTDNTASQVRGIYDTMGRPVNGTPARGIYIVVSEQNGERITTKLIVHE